MAFISVEEALRIIESTACLGRTEQVSVFDCCGRTAAEEISSAVDQPPFDRSPLDGFAFRSEDVAGACRERPARLQQIGYVPAGSGERFAVGPGQCVRIMTGGRIPADCDAVVGIEDAAYADICDCDGAAEVLIFKEVSHHRNYVFAGEDFRKGAVLCRKGQKIDAAMAGCLSAAGVTEVAVCARPAVYVLSTGSEVCRPGEALAEGKIYDSNAVYLTSRLKELGLSCEAGWAADDEDQLKEAILSRLTRYPLILTTGGVSVGDLDLMPKVMEDLGAEILFHGVLLKPGSPLMLAKLDGCHILCLSGNPYAAAATFELFARPLLSVLSGEDFRMKAFRAPLAEDFRKTSAGPRYVRANLKDGKLYVPASHSSGQLLTLSGRDSLLKIPAGDSPLPAGTVVEAYRI